MPEKEADDEEEMPASFEDRQKERTQRNPIYSLLNALQECYVLQKVNEIS